MRPYIFFALFIFSTFIINIGFAQTMIISIPNLNNVSCFGAADGSATVAVTGGTPPYTYQWSNGQTTPTATNLGPGLYQVTVTDFQMLQGTNQALISEPAQLVVSLISQSDINCNRQSGSATVNISGGTMPYNYTWSNGSTGNPGTGLPAGISTATITDANMCSTTLNVSISSNTMLPIVNIATPSPITCNNLTITLNASGSSSGPNFSYNWTTANGNIVSGANSLNPTVNQPGRYSLEIINNTNGCRTSADILVMNNTQAPNIEISPVEKLTCTKSIIEITCENPIGPEYTYEWATQNGNIVSDPTIPVITVDQAGLYVLRVINTNNGCEEIVEVNVEENIVEIEPEILFDGPTSLDCNNPETSLFFDDVFMIDHTWSSDIGISFVDTFTVSKGGNYILTVFDTTSGCLGTDTVEIIEDFQHPDLEIEFLTPPVIDCTNENPIIRVNSPNLSCEYCVKNLSSLEEECNSTGIFSEFIADNPPTNNLIIATAIQNGCSTEDTLKIESAKEEVPYIINSIDPANINSPGELLISLKPDYTGPDWSLNITGLGTNQGINHIVGMEGNDFQVPAGSYILFAESINGCQYSEVITLSVGDCNCIGSFTVEDESCLGSNDGSIRINFFNNCYQEGEYFIYFEGEMNGLPLISGTLNAQSEINSGNILSEGDYFAVFIFEQACHVSLPFKIAGPSIFLSQSYPECSEDDISFFVGISDPNNTYSFLTNPMGTQENVSNNLEKFEFPNQTIKDLTTTNTPLSLTVSAMNGCEKTLDISNQLSIPKPIKISKTNIIEHSQDPDKFILEIHITGGRKPYDIVGMEGNDVIAQAFVINNFLLELEGCREIRFMITDSDGCFYETIIPAANIKGDLEVNEPNCNGQFGDAFWAIDYDLQLLTFAWSTGEETQEIYGLSPGLYSVTATDISNGCTEVQSFEIQEPALTPFIYETNPIFFGQTKGSLNLFSTSNQSWDMHLVALSGGLDTSFILADQDKTIQLEEGVYLLESSTESGCYYENLVIINKEDCSIDARIETTPASCLGSNDGTMRVFYSNATPPVNLTMYISEDALSDTINISNYQSGDLISNLPPFAAEMPAMICCICYLEDANGCIVQYTVIDVRTIINGPIIQYFSGWEGCSDTGSGFVGINVNNGTAPLSYLWSNGETTRTISELSSGNYQVQVTDGLGCMENYSIAIDRPDELFIDQNISFDSASGNYQIELFVSGGVSPYQFEWGTGNRIFDDEVSNILVVGVGEYFAIVRDENGCERILEFNLDGSGINSKNENPGCLIYPNPTNSLLNIKLFDQNTQGTYQFIDLNGKVVYRDIIQKNVTSVDISALSTGMYFIKVHVGEVETIEKVLKF